MAAEQVRLQREAAEQERREREERVRIEQERLQKEAEARAAAEMAEQERLRREAERVAAEAEQERLQREAQERAAAEAAEQERLEQEAIAAEQVRLRREAEERAANEATQQERLQQIQREAEERAAEQERLRQNAAERAAAEEECIAQERAIALAHLEQNGDHISTPTDAVPLERLSSTIQIDNTPDLPSLISQLRETSNSLDGDHSASVEPQDIATQNFLEDVRQFTLDSHAVDVPTDDGSPPRTITAGLEPITEEAEAPNPVPSVLINDDHQRQLREQIAERRRADKEKVANAKRESLENDDHFTQTRSAEDEDLYEPEERVVIAPPDRPTEPPMSPEGVSETFEPDHTSTAVPVASGPRAAQLSQKIASPRQPMGIKKNRKSTIAPKKPRGSRSSFDPSLPRRTRLEFETIMATGPAWPGNQEASPGNVGADSSATTEQAASSASGLARLWRSRKTTTKGAKSRRKEASDHRRQLPPLPDDLGADSMIFWVWKANKWREMERVTLDISDPLRAVRLALRYERDEPVEFVDRHMHAIAAAKCVQAAQAEGTRSVFLLRKDGPLERPITRAMAIAADDLAEETPLAQGRKRGR